MEGKWIQINADKVQAILGVLGALTDNDLGLAMAILVCCIKELDRRATEAGLRAGDEPLAEIISNMLRNHTYEEPMAETAGSA